MTEPVSQTAEARKFLFFKDSRPIGPTSDDKITAAVQEIVHAVVMGFYSVLQMCVPMLRIASFGESPLFDFGDVLLVLVFILAGIGMLTTYSKIGRRPYQSGIPRQRTYGSSALLVGMIVTLGAVFMLMFGLWRFDAQVDQQNDASYILLLAIAFLMLLWSLCTIQERIQWILDLRAEQGHIVGKGAEREDTNRGSQPAWYQRPAK
jgi:NADH:ubiquinone oxidoreductase subunit 6 (subunit J)